MGWAKPLSPPAAGPADTQRTMLALTAQHLATSVRRYRSQRTTRAEDDMFDALAAYDHVAAGQTPWNLPPPENPGANARLVFNRRLADLLEAEAPPHQVTALERLRDEILALLPNGVEP